MKQQQFVVVFLHDESEGMLELEAGCTCEIVDVGHVVVRKTAGTQGVTTGIAQREEEALKNALARRRVPMGRPEGPSGS